MKATKSIQRMRNLKKRLRDFLLLVILTIVA